MKIFKDKKINIRIAAGAVAALVAGTVGVIPVYAHGDDPAESTAETSTEAATAETNVDVLPDVSGNDAGEGSSEEPLTPDGNMSLVDDIGSSTGSGKQFITCVTKNGNYFYIVIDRDDNGTENVHFLNLVDESDLLSLMDDEAKKYAAEQEAETASESTSSMAASTETVSNDTEDNKNTGNQKSNPIPAILALLVFGCAGGYFAFGKLKAKKKAEAERPDPDLDYSDEEDDYEYPEDTETEANDETAESAEGKDTDQTKNAGQQNGSGDDEA